MRVLLVVVIAALLAVIGVEWRDWPGPSPAGLPGEVGAAPSAPSAEALPLDLLPPPADKEDYAVVLERPLFLPDRRPPPDVPKEEADPVAPPVEEPTNLEGMDLNAVVITPDTRTAWVRDPAQPDLVMLEPGGDLAGWKVREVLPDRVELERPGGAQTHTLVLRDYANMPQSQPRAPARTKPAAARPSAAAPAPPAGAGKARAATERAKALERARSRARHARRGADEH